MPPILTGHQLAILESLFAKAGEEVIPGEWLVDGSVTYDKLDSATLQAALNALYATIAQGTKADTAFAWGDHSAAGYGSAMASTIFTAVGSETEVTLASTPKGVVQAFYKAAADTYPRLMSIGTHYSMSGDTLTMISPAALSAGDEVHVYYMT